MERASLAPALNNQGPLKRHYAFHAFVLISPAQKELPQISLWGGGSVFGSLLLQGFSPLQQRLVKG